ncbi:hypothetical protein GIB67_033468 [Kingdonia uniflora]|uniref:Uncharacterized protein n=1 Tax=Kingdonia uniflora TaxID=39325 RepID=A0A7J7MDG0_9MAGN|nr:hypothetical protein GIB67_033468 [Kingdonia uniflora]
MTSSMNDHKVIIGIIGKRETQPHGELQPYGIRYLILLALLLVSSHFTTCWEFFILQPGTPSARPYEAPTLSFDWSKTHGSNYSEPGTPQLSSPAYANTPSPYVSSTPSIQHIIPDSACYLPGTPGVQPMPPGGVMPPVIGNMSYMILFYLNKNMSFSAIIRVESEVFRVLNVSILSSHSLKVWNEKALIFYFADGVRSYLQSKLLGQMLYYVLTTGSGQLTLGEEYSYITQVYELRCNYTRGKFSMLDCIKFAQLVNFTFTVGSKRLKMKLQKFS